MADKELDQKVEVTVEAPAPAPVVEAPAPAPVVAPAQLFVEAAPKAGRNQIHQHAYPETGKRKKK